MKKTLSFLLTLLMLVGLLSALPVSAAGSATITADKSTVSLNQQVTVTAKFSGGDKGIGSLDAYFRYNAKAFEYVSCSGATAAGSAGTIKISYFCQDVTAPKSLTISVTLKAIGTGSGDFVWETEGMYSDEDDFLGSPKKSLSVSATNPTKSGDATLSYLRPSKGTLNPAFDKDVTNYTVKVDHSVTRCLLSYSTSDKNATSSIAGSADLKVGKNTRTITVTAPNGTTKKYTVVITREAGPSTTTTTSGSTSGSTTESTTTTTTVPLEPPKDALEVEVEGKKMLVVGEQPAVTLPANFKWDFATINGVEVPAAKHEKADLSLLYLMEAEGDTAGFFRHDPEKDEFIPYYELTGTAATYVVQDIPVGGTAPAGTAAAPFIYEGVEVTAYQYKDAARKDFVILNVTTPEGVTGLYVFDKSEKTFQRYVEVANKEEKPTATAPVVSEKKDTEEPSAFATFVTENKQVILISAAAVAALALLIIGIILLMRISAGNVQGKH